MSSPRCRWKLRGKLRSGRNISGALKQNKFADLSWLPDKWITLDELYGAIFCWVSSRLNVPVFISCLGQRCNTVLL